MDPHTLSSLAGDLIRMSLNSPHTTQLSETQGRHLKPDPKRFCAYFPSKASFEAKWGPIDDGHSTWEYSAPAAPSRSTSSSSQNSSETCCTAGGSPAQEIVIRYRAGKPVLDHLSDSTRSRGSSASSTTMCSDKASGWGDVSSSSSSTFESGSSLSEWVYDDAHSISSGYDHISPQREPQAEHRQSRVEALHRNFKEALAVMQACGREEHESLVCHRPGCRDTVRGVKAMMYHLHIHDISNTNDFCARCGCRWETEKALAVHTCHKKRREPPSSPLRESFRRALSKIGCRR